MKKQIFKTAALATALLMALACIGCKQEDDDDDSPSVVAVYKNSRTFNDHTNTYTFTFYDDATVVQHYDATGTQNGIAVTISFDMVVGTYTGDLTANGTVTLTATKMVDEDTFDTVLEQVVAQAQANGKTSVTITNTECPLVALTTSSQKTVTISDNGQTLTASSNTYTRQ